MPSFFQSAGFRKYFANTSWLMGEKVLRMGVGLLVSVYVARYLGPEQFGLLSYAISFVGLVSTISTLGLDEIVVRKLVGDETERDVLLGTAFKMKFVGALAVFLVLGIAIKFTSNDNETNLLIFIIASTTLFQSINVIDFYFQSKVLSKFVVFANTLSFSTTSVTKIILIVTEAPLIAFAAVTALESFLLALGLIYFYKKQNFQINTWNFDKRICVSLLKQSWPLILAGMALTVQARIDQVMLKEMINTNEVGQYSIALRLIEAFGFIPVVLKSSLLPSVIKAKKVSLEFYHHRLLSYYRLSMLLFLITAIPIFFLAEPIVTLLFGDAYKPAGVLFSLFAIRLFFTNFGVARATFIVTENLFKFSLITMVCGTLTNVTLNYILIPEYQAVGAIIATIGSFFVTVFLVDLFYKKTRGNLYLMILSMFTFYKLTPETLKR